MGPNDATLWDRYIKLFPDDYEFADYDCWVGHGTLPVDTSGGDIYKENFKELTKKRIDVCATRSDGKIDCIEVRPHAGTSAIGSIMCNFNLHYDDLAGHIGNLAIITDTAQADMERLCAYYNIRLVQLGAA